MKEIFDATVIKLHPVNSGCQKSSQFILDTIFFKNILKPPSDLFGKIRNNFELAV
jgi:hypothetical protein